MPESQSPADHHWYSAAAVNADGDLAVLIRRVSAPDGISGHLETYGIDPVRGLDPAPRHSTPCASKTLRISDDGDLLLQATRDSFQLHAMGPDGRWEPCSRDDLAPYGEFASIAMSPSGHMVAAQYHFYGPAIFQAGSEEGLRLVVLSDSGGFTGGIAVSSRGEVAATTRGGMAIVRPGPDIRGQWAFPSAALPHEEQPARLVLFSADGSLLAASTWGGVAVLYRMRPDRAPERLPEVFPGGRELWTILGFAPDSGLLAVRDGEDAVRFAAVDPTLGLAPTSPSIPDLRFDARVLTARFTRGGRFVVITQRPEAFTYDGFSSGTPFLVGSPPLGGVGW